MARAVRIWGALCIAAAVLVTAVLIWANTAADPDSLGKLSGYLVFNDHWGTERGYCWRIGLESYAELPILHKIFGYGPDTYGLLTWSYRSQTIQDLGVYYESAHNEFLQYFVTIGPFGCAAYIAFLVSSIVRMLRHVKENPLLLAIAAAVLAYNVQAFINIGLPIATPVMWLLLSMGHAGIRPDWELALPKRRKKQAADDAAVSPDAAISSGDAGGEEKE